METNNEELRLQVSPWGPDPEVLRSIECSLFEHPLLRDTLADARYRLLSLDVVDAEAKSSSPKPPGRFRATIYDYTNNRTLIAQGCADDPEVLMVSETGTQPLPSAGEFEAAVALLMNDERIGPDLRAERLATYRPMPPLIQTELPDGRVERTLAVGLYNEYVGHRIVGVNMIQQTVLQDVRDTAHAADVCGPPPSGDCGEGGGTQRVNVQVWQGNTLLWSFVAVRPSASSGTNGSGIELQHVYYRGKQVLYRAHVPILNIEYYGAGQEAGCGPTYRDWQNSETCFQANGVDVVPGFRLCSTPAKTILDTDSDDGNFRGVAIYVQGREVVLVSELQAGWYRYISEWHLRSDGTIRPRFGFGATNNPCTCKPHHHHAYWRFDFDIQTAGNNLVQEFNDPPLFPNTNWHNKTFEIRRLRDASRKRKWRITNAASGSGYDLVPGTNDGTADSYGIGDMWVLKYRSTELDDGHPFSTNPAVSKADLDKFVNGEPVANQDVVVWYAGHFLHDAAHGGAHIIGPELQPVNW